MTIIILGGSGFFGRSLLKKLKKAKLPYKLLIHKKTIDNSSCFFGDIIDKNFLENNISNGDIIVNLIGQVGKQMFDQNIKGSYNLLNSVSKKKNIKIIFASTLLVYGESLGHSSQENDSPHPLSEYGIVKLISENLYKLYSDLFGLDVTILRFANIYGPKKESGIIAKCIDTLKEQTLITLNQNGNQTRDFLHIDDAVEAILLTLKYPSSGFEIFNISSGVGVQIHQIVDLIEKCTKKIIPKEFVNEISDVKYIVGNNLKAKKLLNFSIKIDINKGIKDTVEKS